MVERNEWLYDFGMDILLLIDSEGGFLVIAESSRSHCFHKRSQPCKYCNQHLMKISLLKLSVSDSEMTENCPNIVVYELMSYNSFSND